MISSTTEQNRELVGCKVNKKLSYKLGSSVTNILRTTGPGMKPACTQAQWNVDRSHIPQAVHGQLFEGQLVG